MSRIEIPRKIDVEEILVRLVKDPNHYNPVKEEVKKEIFTPNSKEEVKPVVDGKTLDMAGVSLLRLIYTDADTCKQHAKNMLNTKVTPPEKFAGVILFKQSHLNNLCSDDAAIKLEQSKIISSHPVVTVHGTPMDDTAPKPNYIPEGIPVYTDSAGNPMHADLIYNFPQPIKGVPNNPVNKLAKQLAEQLFNKKTFKLDTTENPNVWGGEDLRIN